MRILLAQGTAKSPGKLFLDASAFTPKAGPGSDEHLLVVPSVFGSIVLVVSPFSPSGGRDFLSGPVFFSPLLIFFPGTAFDVVV